LASLAFGGKEKKQKEFVLIGSFEETNGSSHRGEAKWEREAKGGRIYSYNWITE